MDVLLPRILWNILPLGLIVLVVGYTVFGEEGLLNRHQLKQQLYAAQAQADTLESHNASLRIRIQDLREDPDAIKRVAAERLLIAEPGSTIYRFE